MWILCIRYKETEGTPLHILNHPWVHLLEIIFLDVLRCVTDFWIISSGTWPSIKFKYNPKKCIWIVFSSCLENTIWRVQLLFLCLSWYELSFKCLFQKHQGLQLATAWMYFQCLRPVSIYFVLYICR